MERLANTAHLRALAAAVVPPDQPGHATFPVAGRPEVGVLWTYAEPDAAGEHRPVGGGAHDPGRDRYGQGAFNADDMSRAAVAFLRHWRWSGDEDSRDHAAQLLRGVAYLQTVEGPAAGCVVLWMQPDGTLNPSADPPEHPDPSDSAPSYWLARSLWAFGEGWAAFRAVDPTFAAFLAARIDLALDAVDRTREPLIQGAADASSEALLGLVAARDAGPRVRAAATRFAGAIAGLARGDAGTWPYGAILSRPEGVRRVWGAQMAGALAAAGRALGRPEWIEVAVGEAGRFVPHLLVTGAADDGADASDSGAEIAYGADVTLQNLLAVARATGEEGFAELAGVAAGWFFGDNPAGRALCDPDSGRTLDGVLPDGAVNPNAGAESTIHGLLSMLALDRHPGLAHRALMAEGATRQRGRDGDVAWLVVAGPHGGHVLVRSTVAEDRTIRIPLPETWSGTVRAYDDRGRRLSDADLRGTEIDAPVAAGGFTIIAGRSRATDLAPTPYPPALHRRGSKVG